MCWNGGRNNGMRNLRMENTTGRDAISLRNNMGQLFVAVVVFLLLTLRTQAAEDTNHYSLFRAVPSDELRPLSSEDLR